MYIQIKNDSDAPVLISRKLYKELCQPKDRKRWFIQLSRIKGSDRFVIVKRTAGDTFRTQCSMVTLTPDRDKRCPAMFMWTIPSLEYFMAVTGIRMVTGKVLKVKKVETPNVTYYEICNR